MQQEDILVLVDENDTEIGTGMKQDVHVKGLLHRAFSVFIFKKEGSVLRLLMQKRNIKKYHCGGLWTNTCCSHPRPNESITTAATRRLNEELMLSNIELEPAGSFVYKAGFSNGLTEHEYDHVLIGYLYEDHKAYNSDEIDEIAWMDIEYLKRDIVEQPIKYTPWFNQAFSLALSYVDPDIHKDYGA